MSLERDEGFAALQRGDIAAAIAQLERAIQQTPEDYYAYMYLGAAYGQAERHSEAVSVLTRAVEVEPANAQARYNLGIALERAGWPQEALTAFQQALTLQPDYPKAKEAAARLRPAPPLPQPAPFTVDPLATRTLQLSSENLPRYPEPTLQTGGVPPYAQPTMQTGGGLPPHPTVAPPVYHPAYSARSAYYEDNFSIGQSFQDWIAVLKSPQEFFRSQAGREGFNAPISMLMTYHFGLAIAAALGLVFVAFSAPNSVLFLLIGFIIVLVFLFLFALLGNFITAGILHIVGKLFGNRAAYSGSFRACIYAQAPYWAVASVSFILTLAVTGASFSQRMEQGQTDSPPGSYVPSNPGGFSNPPGFPESRAYRTPQTGVSSTAAAVSDVTNILTGLSAIWALVLLGVGVCHLQRLSTGGAVGTLFLGIIVPTALLFGLLVALVVAANGMG